MLNSESSSLHDFAQTRNDDKYDAEQAAILNFSVCY